MHSFKLITINFLLSIAALFAMAGTPLADTVKGTWKTGRVVSVSLNGYGNRSDSSFRTSKRRQDLWWSYCIASEDQMYSVLSRQNPERTGLKEKSQIDFLEKKGQIYVVDPAGKRIPLRILRKGKATKCP
jgi:hypothetical protein